MEDRINLVRKLIREAGATLLAAYNDTKKVATERKSDTSFLTRNDTETEKFLVDRIKSQYPDDGFIGEEGDDSASKDGYRWVIDPIDGTTNFVYKQTFFTISVGLKYGDELVGGVLYEPVLDKLYYAMKGKGFVIEDEPGVGGVSETRNLTESYNVYSIGSKPHLRDINIRLYPIVYENSSRIRVFGSPSYELTQIASGYIDLIINVGGSEWDLSAGVCCVREAGGVALDFNGNEWKGNSTTLIAGNEILVRQMIDMLPKL